MDYKDYLFAARRHRATCDFLLKEISDTSNTIHIEIQKKILQNVYYLSGYIIECALSYTVFKIIKYDRKKSVYDYDKFDHFFRKHSFKSNQRKIDIITEKGGVIPSEIPIIGNKKVEDIEKEMYDTWDADARYLRSYPNFELNVINVKKFFTLSSDIYVKLNKI